MSAYVADALVVFGLATMTLAVVGLFRMPTTRLRLHAASKASAVGLLPIAIAAAIGGGGVRALLVWLFVIVTAPVTAHVLAQVAEETDEGEEDG
jgi:monovalent cation/proton antiporter MnhG/PhaG subunit